ncbi:MAG: hypothetical protein ACRD9R_02845 [Pyrinomonadaceae bacterium]
MSELNEARWSVISERGREASGLSFAEAMRLVGDLQSRKVYGTCVVTDEAAGRLAGASGAPDAAATTTQSPAGKAPAKTRAPRRKKKEG